MDQLLKFGLVIVAVVLLSVVYVELKDRWDKKHNKKNSLEDWRPR